MALVNRLLKKDLEDYAKQPNQQTYDKMYETLISCYINRIPLYVVCSDIGDNLSYRNKKELDIEKAYLDNGDECFLSFVDSGYALKKYNKPVVEMEVGDLIDKMLIEDNIASLIICNGDNNYFSVSKAWLIETKRLYGQQVINK